MEATGINRHLVTLLHDPRDLPMVHLLFGCALVGALGIGLFFVQAWFWPLAVAYLAFWNLGYLDRFILLVHCTSHRPLGRGTPHLLHDPLVPVLAPVPMPGHPANGRGSWALASTLPAGLPRRLRILYLLTS